MAILNLNKSKDDLKQQIISGNFENGDRFYTEAELIKMFNVSSITVVRAAQTNLRMMATSSVNRKGNAHCFTRRKHKRVEFSDIETFPIQKDKVTVLSIERGNEL